MYNKQPYNYFLTLTIGDLIVAISTVDLNPSRVGTPDYIAPDHSTVPPGIGKEQSSLSPVDPNMRAKLPNAPSCMGRIKSWLGCIIESIKKCWNGVKAWFFRSPVNAPAAGVTTLPLKSELEAFLAMVNNPQITNATLVASFAQIREGREALSSALEKTQEEPFDFRFRSNEVKGALKYSIMLFSLNEILEEVTHEGRRAKFGALSTQNQGIVNVLIGLNLSENYEDQSLKTVISDIIEHSMLDSVVEKSITDANFSRTKAIIRGFLSFEMGEALYEGSEERLINRLRLACTDNIRPSI